MAAPNQGFDAGSGLAAGLQPLQTALDDVANKLEPLSAAITGLTQAVTQGGLQSSVITASGAQGQRIGTGSMNAGATQAAFTGNGYNVADLSQAGATSRNPPRAPRAPRNSSSTGSAGQTGSGSGQNYSFSSPASAPQTPGQARYAAWASGVSTATTPTYGNNAGSQVGPVFANGGYVANGGTSPAGLPVTQLPYGGAGGAGPAPSGYGASGGNGWSTAVNFAGNAGQAAMSGVGSMLNAGSSNSLMYNAYGTQMANQWGGSAQAYQNSAFGSFSTTNFAAQGSQQQAMQEYGTINSVTGGGAIGSGAMVGATNSLAYTNVGMGAGAASSLAAQMYNPSSAMMLAMTTGVQAINPATGQDNSMGSILTGLAQKGYIGGGGYNSQTGQFSQSALNASFVAGRGKSYMSLLDEGYSQDQISDIQSLLNTANTGAAKGHTSVSDIMSLMGTAESGNTTKAEAAQSQLAKDDIGQSALTKLGNEQSVAMGQQQGESGGFTKAVNDFSGVMQQATTAVSAFLKKTGLGGLVGGVQGVGFGAGATGFSGWLGRGMEAAGSLLQAGAASVSATSSQTSSAKTGSNKVSGIAGQSKTAVRDAEQQIGKPYVSGGTSPAAGFDCAGLVQWAYGQAGVKLGRTQQQQWSQLRDRAVSLSDVQEGDIVFSSGVDGSPDSPGHEALVISSSKIIEAPYGGANVRERAYNPGEWNSAARPLGSVPRKAAARAALGAGGAGGSGDSALDLAANADSQLFSGGPGAGGGSLLAASVLNASGQPASGQTSGKQNGSASGTSMQQGFTGGGTAEANQHLAEQIIARLYPSWARDKSQFPALVSLWMDESGWNNKAMNAQSGAYGIAQALGHATSDETAAQSQTGWNYPPEFGAANPSPHGDSSASAQIQWGLSYIKGSYGSPAAALTHENAYHWYASGTDSAAPGYAVVGERGPELVRLSGGQQVMNAFQTASVLRGQSSVQAPYTTGSQGSYRYDPASPVGGGGGGRPVTVSIGGVTVSAPNMTGTQTTADTQVLGQLIVQQVEQAMQKSSLLQQIANGVTG